MTLKNMLTLIVYIISRVTLTEVMIKILKIWEDVQTCANF